MKQVVSSARSIMPPDVGLSLSDGEFDAISRVIRQETGIVITAPKRSMLVSRLARRLRALGLPDFSAYLRLLEGEAGEAEREQLVSAITTNVTSFFREPHHFEALAGMLPAFLERAKAGGRIRIWSAGCSTGQEAYSIAATILEHSPELARLDLRILATDIDPVVVETARQGIYDQRLLGDNPPRAIRRFIEERQGSGNIAVAPALRSLIRFEVLNLLETWPFAGKFDVIFCRNVVIYFDAETRRSLWTRFAGRIPAGGVLFIGHSERMDPLLEPCFTPTGMTQYLRTPHEAPGDHGGMRGYTPARRAAECP